MRVFNGKWAILRPSRKPLEMAFPGFFYLLSCPQPTTFVLFLTTKTTTHLSGNNCLENFDFDHSRRTGCLPTSPNIQFTKKGLEIMADLCRQCWARIVKTAQSKVQAIHYNEHATLFWQSRTLSFMPKNDHRHPWRARWTVMVNFMRIGWKTSPTLHSTKT